MIDSDPVLESFRRRAAEAGIAFSEEDFARLRPRYAQMLDQLRVLRELDLSAVEPALVFALPGLVNAEGG